MSKKSRHTFVQGAIILFLANSLGKVAGALFKIPLTNLIGQDGMGLFASAYNVYTWIFVISTAGLPVAISKMVSESSAKGREIEVRRTVRVAMTAFTIFGAVGTLVLMLGANLFTLKNPPAYYSVLAVSPTVLFVVIMSVFRGYFQGLQNMVPTAVSQVIESFSKLIVGLSLVIVLLNMGFGIEIVSAGAIFGVTAGSVLGSVYIVIYYLSKRKKREKPTFAYALSDSSWVILKKLVKIAIPISLGASIMSLTNFIDYILVYDRLYSIGFNQSTANALYGCYNMAVTLFNLPPTLIFPIGISVLPLISELMAVHRYESARRNMESALRICCLMAFPCAFGLMLFSKPILELLYPMIPDAVVTAAPLMTKLAPAVIFVCIATLTNSLLQSLGRVLIPVKTMLFGGIVKIISNYILIGNPEIGISGAPISTNLCYISISLLNLIALWRLGFKPKILPVLLKPFFTGILSVMGALVFYDLAAQIVDFRIALFAAICIAALLYIIFLLLAKAFVREDILLLPKGQRIANILERYRWLS